MDPLSLLLYCAAAGAGFVGGLYWPRQVEQPVPLSSPPPSIKPSQTASLEPDRLVRCVLMNKEGTVELSSRVIAASKRKDYILRPHGKLQSDLFTLHEVKNDTYIYRQD